MFEQLPTKGQVDSFVARSQQRGKCGSPPVSQKLRTADIIMLRAIGKFPFANQAVEMMWGFLGITQSLKGHDQ